MLIAFSSEINRDLRFVRLLQSADHQRLVTHQKEKNEEIKVEHSVDHNEELKIEHSEDRTGKQQSDSEADDHLFRQLEWKVANWNALGERKSSGPRYFRDRTTRRAHIPTSLLAVKCATETMHCEQGHAFSVTLGLGA